MKENIEQNKWVACSHKHKLPVGDYLLRIENIGLSTQRHFKVTERQKELEIPYFHMVAYFKVPAYTPAP